MQVLHSTTQLILLRSTGSLSASEYCNRGTWGFLSEERDEFDNEAQWKPKTCVKNTGRDTKEPTPFLYEAFCAMI